MQNIKYIVCGLLVMATSAVFALKFGAYITTSNGVYVFPVYTGGPKACELLEGVDEPTAQGGRVIVHPKRWDTGTHSLKAIRWSDAGYRCELNLEKKLGFMDRFKSGMALQIEKNGKYAIKFSNGEIERGQLPHNSNCVSSRTLSENIY